MNKNKEQSTSNSKSRFLKVAFCIVVICVATIVLFGCGSQANRVSRNVSQEAENFNVIRRLSVINLRSDKPVFELVAAFSISVDSDDEQLEVTCEVGDGKYKKHFIDIHAAEIMYFVEDVGGASVSKYHYEVNFQPDMLLPVEIVSKD